MSSHLIVGVYASQARHARAVELSAYDLADDAGGWEKGPRGGLRRRTASGGWEYQKKGGGMAKPRQAKQPAAAKQPRKAKKPAAQRQAQQKPGERSGSDREADRQRAAIAKRGFPALGRGQSQGVLETMLGRGGGEGSRDMAQALGDAARSPKDAEAVRFLASKVAPKANLATPDGLREVAEGVLRWAAEAKNKARDAANELWQMQLDLRPGQTVHAGGRILSGREARMYLMDKAKETRNSWLSGDPAMADSLGAILRFY